MPRIRQHGARRVHHGVRDGELADVGNAITLLHGLVGTFTFVSGLWLVLQMNDVVPPHWHVQRWKALMRITLAGYWTVAVLGIVTYYYWYAA